ncbi:DUF4179 domain-containing protein [Sporosarcina obsidiansis]|uniref:DUF4179 domain-containing protein n=1 Tax=Sporosarcina obsidiansis TaxID=2660748 RepID=UPI00129AFD54|nr:DUF4179 domain-containing protein [Sporosarcina obsidiansis]
MNCPTIDELSKYVDDLVTEKESDRVQAHVETCSHCQVVVEAFLEEQRFVMETLQNPELPDDFADKVLGQLEPFEQKVARRKTPWKKVMLSAAGVVLAVGLSAALSPSFAQLIGGFFSSEQVDDGLRLAMEAGLAERVDLEVEDQGITLKVEDVMADSSRVSLSYQVLKNGKPQDTYFDSGDSANKVTAFDANGNEITRLSSGWWDGGDYGLFEFSLREYEEIDQLTIRFDVVELNGVKGNWQLEVPVDLREKRQLTKTLPLNDATITTNGVKIDLQKAQMAPSSTELFYETSFMEEEQASIEKARKEFMLRFGSESVESLINAYETAIAYHLEDHDGNVLYAWNRMNEEKGHEEAIGMLSGSGENLDTLGHVKWVNSFIPKKEQPDVTFVLDGVYKTVPTDFSIKIKPNELKDKPYSFEFEGNDLTVVKAKNETNYSFRKSLLPIAKESTFIIEMEGNREPGASELGWWLVEDDKGNVYQAGPSGSVVNEKVSFELTLPRFKEEPKELTLHLFSVKRYEPVNESWKFPLY